MVLGGPCKRVVLPPPRVATCWLRTPELAQLVSLAGRVLDYVHIFPTTENVYLNNLSCASSSSHTRFSPSTLLKIESLEWIMYTARC